MRVPLTVSSVSPVFQLFASMAPSAAFGVNYKIELLGRGTEEQQSVYSSEEGGELVSQPLVTDAGGRIEGAGGEQCWVESGSYDLLVGSARVPWDAGIPALAPMRETVLYASDASGFATNGGLSEDDPKTLLAALATIEKYGPRLPGIWKLVLAPEEFGAPTSWPDMLRGADYFTLIGSDATSTEAEEKPEYNGSEMVTGTYQVPTQPTTYITADGGGGDSRGIQIASEGRVRIDSIGTRGFSVCGVDVDRGVALFRNHWDEESKMGRYCKHGSTFHAGGRLIQNTFAGISELFGHTRSHIAESYAEEFGVDLSEGGAYKRNAIPYATRIIEPGEVGYHAKEHCNGHLGPIYIDGAPTAIELDSQCVANMSLVAITGPTSTAVVLNDSEVHSTSGIRWNWGNENEGDGSGAADLTGISKSFLPLGRSNVQQDYWDGTPDEEGGVPVRLGYAPPRLIGSAYGVTVTGTTAKTLVGEATTISAKQLNAEGRKLISRVTGILEEITSGSGNVIFTLTMSGETVLVEHKVAVGGTSGGYYEIDTEVTCPEDGNHQFVWSTLKIDGMAAKPVIADKTIDMSANHSVRHYITPAHASNKIKVKTLERWF